MSATNKSGKVLGQVKGKGEDGGVRERLILGYDSCGVARAGS